MRHRPRGDPPEARRVAIALYGGQFLPDVAIGQNAWVEWLRGRRQRLEALAVDALVLGAQDAMAGGRPKEALALGERALALNGWREDDYRVRMSAFVAVDPENGLALAVMAYALALFAGRFRAGGAPELERRPALSCREPRPSRSAGRGEVRDRRAAAPPAQFHARALPAEPLRQTPHV